MDNRILQYIWLSNALKPGSKTPKLLFDYFKTIENIFNATKEDYVSLGLSNHDIVSLSNKDLTLSTSHYNYCKSEKIGFLCYEDSYYPERLKIISNPPPLFYYRGRLQYIDDFPCFAMVGTRTCSEDGLKLAYKTAYEASSCGAVIVNGLADGIDGACISGSLDANGYAIGVLGCGIDRIYPEKNKDIFYKLSANGLILTEFAPFTEPKGSNFPVRNRVISGLSLATCIFEASAQRSGAMITARHALEQGRRIFAVPGKPYDASYSGPLELIKSGACVLTGADDVLTEYALMFPHRINLRHISPFSEEKMQEYVNSHFDKNTVKKSANKNKTTPVSSKAKHKNTKLENNHVLTQNIESSKEHAVENTSQNNSVLIQSFDETLLSETEKSIFEIFKNGNEYTLDEIASYGIKIEDVLSSVTLLEVYGFICAIPGGRYKIKTI